MQEVIAIVVCCRKTGLGVIRALAREEIPIVGLCYGEDQVGAYSRHLAECFWCPDPHDDEPGFVRYLWSLADRYAGAVLIPADDASLVALSRHRDRLETRFRVVAQQWAVVRQLIEKRLTYVLARRHGIPCPRICITRDLAAALEFATAVGFPCLVKPSVGHEFFHRYHAKMLLIRDAAHLQAVLNDLADYGSDLMLSEWIPGDDTCGVNYNSFYMDGAPIVEFTAQKLRLRPTGIGFPVAVISKKVPEVIELGRQMIAAFGYNGFSCMEFKRDMRDGVYKLMELNGRHNHSSLLDLACGINFPYYSYVRALDRTVPVPQVVQSDGVYWLDELKDIRSALAACRKGGGGLGRFLRPYLRRHASAVVSLADPLPSLHTLADGVAAIVGRRSRAEPRFRASGDSGSADGRATYP